MLRLGIVDFDSSHSVEFTRRFNHIGVDRDERVDGARVVAGWPGDSEMGPERIPGFLAEMKTLGVEIVDRLDDLLDRIDGVLILSMCGAAHWKRVRPFLEAGIPAFVDKPFSGSLADAEAMLQLAQQKNVTLSGGSAMRFATEVQQLVEQRRDIGDVLGAISYGPAKRAPGNPGLLHYGVHTVELLFEIMGTGCESVTTTWSEGSEVVTGRWTDGRIGTVRGTRCGSTAYGFVAFCQHGVIARDASTHGTYTRLCRAIVRSFETQQPAIPHASTREVLRFIHAALASENAHGAVVRLDQISSSNASAL